MPLNTKLQTTGDKRLRHPSVLAQLRTPPLLYLSWRGVEQIYGHIPRLRNIYASLVALGSLFVLEQKGHKIEGMDRLPRPRSMGNLGQAGGDGF